MLEVIMTILAYVFAVPFIYLLHYIKVIQDMYRDNKVLNIITIIVIVVVLIYDYKRMKRLEGKEI